MKYLTVAIPCYNSAEYMMNAIKSLLVAGDDIEIIVVDDGSVDETKDIGLMYAKKYPDIVKCISKENGGHGSAVNTGLANSTGLYYKVLDSDDWFDKESLIKIIETIKKHHAEETGIDMYIANYVYENQSTGKSTVINYKSAMPKNQVFTWTDMGHFKITQNILMHSVIYRTELLKQCGISLPEHTFYVDNIFVYEPLPYVKKMYYMDLDLYRYFIGRSDQSVNEQIMINRIDQQIKITKIMIDSHDLSQIEDEKLRKYMVKYLAMMMTVSSALLVKDNTETSLKKKDKLWAYLKQVSPDTYKLINKTLLGRPMQMRSKVGRKIILSGYSISRRIIGFS